MSYASRIAAQEEAEDAAREREAARARCPKAADLYEAVLALGRPELWQLEMSLGDMVQNGQEVTPDSEAYARAQMREVAGEQAVEVPRLRRTPERGEVREVPHTAATEPQEGSRTVSDTRLAVMDEAPGAIVEARALIQHAPDVVLAEAQKAAAALQDVINSKPRKVIMNGEQYLELEDWMLVGRFYGITAREDGDPEFVALEGTRGFKASSVAIDRDGRVLSRATAYCLNDEEKWSSRAKYAWMYATQSGSWSETDPGPAEIVWIPNPNKPGKNMPKKERQQVGEENVPLFQLSSMAQTRANAKVLRNVLAWVVVLAGYRPTPAEEIEETRGMVHAPAQADVPAHREPGEDVEDAEVIQTSVGPVHPGSGERAAAAGVSPDQSVPNARPAPRRADPPRSAPPANGGGKGAIPACPKCGEVRPVIRSKFADAPPFYCFPSKGGCGKKFGDQLPLGDGE